LGLLDAFLEAQGAYRQDLIGRIQEDGSLTPLEKLPQTIREHFRLLQACDNLSLLACVAFASPANLLHPLPLNGGGASEVQVTPVGPRRFNLDPWPFADAELTVTFPARHISGHRFASSADLEAAFHAGSIQEVEVTLTRSV
jgi:hypothetical protein